MKAILITLLTILSFQTLSAQQNYWSMQYRGAAPLYPIPFGLLEKSENSIRAYGTSGFIDVSPFGRVLAQKSFSGISSTLSTFYLDIKNDFTIVGEIFKFSPDVIFKVYGEDETDFLYEIDLGIQVNPDIGYPIAVNITDNEYYVFADDNIVRINVTPTGFTEIIRFTGVGPFTTAAAKDGIVYAANSEGNIYAIINDAVGPIFYSHEGTLKGMFADEDGLVAVGTKDDQNSMTKLDYQGNVIFSKKYDHFEGRAVAPTADGGYIHTGKRASGFISKTDGQGNELWSYLDMNRIGVEIIEDEIGNIYVLGMSDLPSSTQAELVKVSADGIGDAVLEPNQTFPLAVNNIEAHISSGGTIFLDDNQNGAYFYPRGGETVTIFASGLWMSGFDPGGNLKLAAQGYQTNEDFQMGPIDSDPTFFNRVWSVKKEFIQDFRNDIADGEKDQDWLLDIIEWPAKGNTIYNPAGEALTIDTDMAPFEDVNNDGLYNPNDGDYPKIKGDQMLWWIFNDDKIHLLTNGDQLNLEVEASLYAFSCSDNIAVDNSTFLDFKIKNRGLEDITDFRLAYWQDPDLGCYEDDYMGSIPAANAVYVYNSDAQDGNGNGNCAAGIPTFGNEIPVQTTMFVDRSMDNFMYYNNSVVGGPWPQGTTDPQAPLEFQHYISGLWRDGTPLTVGGYGYDPGSTPATPYAFPANPATAGEWSMCEENIAESDRRIIMSSEETDFLPGAIKNFRLAFTTFPDVDYPCPDVDFIETALIELQNDIDLGALDYNLDLGPDIPTFSTSLIIDAGAGAASYLWSNGSTDQSITIDAPGIYRVTVTTHFGCEVKDEISVGIDVATQDIVENKYLKVYPNPADEYLNIEFINTDYSTELTLEVYDINGRLRDFYQEKNNSFSGMNRTIDTNSWPVGMYLLKFKLDNKVFVERVMVR